MTRVLQFVAVLLAVLWTVSAEEVVAQTTPTVTAMSLNSPGTTNKVAARHNDYYRGEMIQITVTFSDSVVVTGTPYIELGVVDYNNMDNSVIGTCTDCFAEYLPRTRDTTLVMVFEYQVQLGDRANRGISIAADALKLNDGTINAKSGGTPADLDLTSYAFTEDANRRVSNRRGQAITNVSLNSPPNGDTFRRGDTIRVTYTYNQSVSWAAGLWGNVMKVRVTIGANVRLADYVSGHATMNWAYRYIVRADDMDADGISISRRSILEKGLTGNVIHNGNLDNYSARNPGRRQRIDNSANHKVDGRTFVTLALSAASISESGGVSTVTATLDVTASTAAVVTVGATAVPPAAAGDFTLSTARTLTIAAGQTTSTGTVTISAVDDMTKEPNKSVTVSGTVSSGFTAPSNVTLTIIEDDVGVATLALSPASISENGGVTTVTATLSEPEGAVTITVSATPDVPAVVGDFTLSPANTLTIAAGQTTSTGLVTITAVDNSASTASKSIVVRGTADDTPDVVQPPASVTLTITDDDTPQVALVLSPASISENGGVSTVTATLDVTASTAATITVSATAVSPAVAGDFTLSTARTLTIAAGQTTSTGTVTITAVDNTTDALDKSVTVSGTATGGDNATNPSGVTLTIADDEAATATLALSPASISENGGVTTVTATLSTPEDGAVTITVSAVPDPPAVVGDYTLSTPNTLTIAAGSTTSTGLVTITTVDNSAATGSKTVTVSGTADDTPDVVQPPSDVTLTITDDDVPQVAIVLSPASISENGEVSTVTATLDRIASTAATVIIEATAVSPAVMGDFTLSDNDTLIIAASATTSTGTVTITAVNNTTDAPDKSVTVEGTATGGNSATSPSPVTLTITDDDMAPTVTLAVNPASISENGELSTVTAALSRPSSAATTITVRPVAGAYTVGSDSTIAFAAGDTANASDTVVISTVDNSLDEADRTATVSGVMVNDQGVGAVTGASLTLTDDDDPPVISIDSPSMTESATLSFTVSLSAASGREITVAYADAASGTATSGTDYTALTAGTLTFAIGVTSQTLAVSVTDDGTDEPDETVAVILSGPTYATLGTATGTGTITDNDDPPLLSIDSPSVVEVNSGSTPLQFTVTLNAASGKQVTVAYADAGTGSADSGTDYTALTAGTLTFAVGVTSQTFDVSVTGDADDESNETMVVTLSSPTNATFAGSAMTLTSTGTIIDNDGMPALSIAVPPRVMEGGATLTFRVYLSPASAQQVTVIYQDAGTGSATSGTDYAALATGTLVFAAGETEKTFAVSLIDDNVKEPDETVIITLRSPVNAVFDGGVTTLTITGTIINDDANPTVSISSPSVAEGNSGSTTLPFTVTLSTATMHQVTVAYADAGTGSATSGTDYTALAAGTLIFAPGETSQTLDISVRGDAAVEPDETVVIALSDPVNALLGMASGTGTITNDDRSPTDPEPEPDPDTDPVFIEAADPQTYRKNQAIEFTLPAAIDGNGALTYTLTDLPEGLTFDAATLTVSGTPSEATEKAIYTLTVTDEDDDSAEMSFFITVLANVAPSFGDASVDAQSYLRKQEIESLTLPRAIGGDGSLTYALTPDLPDDLVFDAETRMLSGIPLEVIAETTYTLTATDGDGDEATLTFTLEVMADPMPTFGDTTVAAQSYLQHREIDALTLPQATGGDGTLTYALTPDLPEGLTFDAETLIISGTPSKAMDAMTYTLTATDGNGDVARLVFTLEVPDLMPTFGDTTIAAQSYLVNQQIESLTLPAATGGDGMLAYFLLPFLPDSLTFDPKTRVLSGTPTEAMTETTYTLSALDADGDVASLTFTLAVQMPSSDFDGDGDVNFADFLTFAGKFGSRRGQDRYDARCDLNADGQIDFADFLIFAANFGATG